MKKTLVPIGLLLSIPYWGQQAGKNSIKNLNLPVISEEVEYIDTSLFRDRSSFKTETEGYTQHFTKTDRGYALLSYTEDSPFYISKLFHPNGTIRSKSVSYMLGSNLGKIYNYTSDGKVCDSLDSDAGFTFTWEDVLEYCDKRNISYYTGEPENRIKGTDIFKSYSNGNPRWNIILRNDKGAYSQEIILDGKSGRRIRNKKPWISLDVVK